MIAQADLSFRVILPARTRSLKPTGFEARRRRAYEGLPQAKAEGAQAILPDSDDGELKRETNWRVCTV